MLDENLWYSITINSCDDFQYFNQSNRLNLWYSEFVMIVLKMLRNCADVNFFPEISDSGRLHLHGYIKFFDLFTFLLDKVHDLKNISNIKIDTIDFGGTYELYIRKDQFDHYQMRKQCESRYLPYEIDMSCINEIGDVIDVERSLVTALCKNTKFKQHKK